MKAIITCGGLGTRLLPFTKELPKEMAPVFYKTENKVHTIPLIQLIFETLYDAGIREFCFVTGKTKRAIENHFTPEESPNQNDLLDSFYEKLSNSKIFWITQNYPKGFGDALRYANSFVGNEDFILQAGDVAVLQKNKTNLLTRLIELSINSTQDAILSIRRVSDPKRHGIVTLEDENKDLPRITSAIEKPDNPQTDLGIMPIYLFNHNIFDALEKIQPDKNNEIQVTDAIQKLLDDSKVVKAIRVDDEKFWDVGTPEAYWQALNESYHHSERS